MKHLITGGSGFLGNLIARRLHARGEQVRILDVWEDTSRPKDIEYFECDILVRDGVAKAMEGVDVVHHNAALVAQTRASNKFWEVNVEGARIVAEEAVKARVNAFVHTSSTAVFGSPAEHPITNETPTKPIEAYGRSKLAGEQVVHEICDKPGLPLIVIRPRACLGHGRLGIFQILFDWIQQGRNVYVIGTGEIPFQFVHAYDLMDFYMLALDAGATGVFNVGTDRFGSLRGDLEDLITYAGTESKVRSLPEFLTISSLRMLHWMRLSPLTPWHYLTYHKPCCFEVQPLIDMGWKPRYSNKEMFRETYDWFCEHYDPAKLLMAGSPHRRPLKQGVLWLVKQLS